MTLCGLIFSTKYCTRWPWLVFSRSNMRKVNISRVVPDIQRKPQLLRWSSTSSWTTSTKGISTVKICLDFHDSFHYMLNLFKSTIWSEIPSFKFQYTIIRVRQARLCRYKVRIMVRNNCLKNLSCSRHHEIIVVMKSWKSKTAQNAGLQNGSPRPLQQICMISDELACYWERWNQYLTSVAAPSSG